MRPVRVWKHNSGYRRVGARHALPARYRRPSRRYIDRDNASYRCPSPRSGRGVARQRRGEGFATQHRPVHNQTRTITIRGNVKRPHTHHPTDSLIIPTIVITGPVGVGKTAVSTAMSDLLIAANEPHALIDMDTLRMSYPRPAHDRFHMALGLRNLAALWANYRAAGAECLILADVVESQADADAYRLAVPNAEVTVVRLLASRDALWRRLAQRESGESLRWHQNRALELAALMEKEAIGNLLVETDEKTAFEVADEILRLVF